MPFLWKQLSCKKVLGMLLMLGLILSFMCSKVFQIKKEKDQKKPALWVFLCIGQSNMAGRSPIPEASGEVSDILLFNAENKWETARQPYNRYSTIRKSLGLQRYNFCEAFGKHLLEYKPGIQVGLVINARGGSSITEWRKGQPYFSEAIRRIRSALEQNEGHLEAILWHQGERNIEDREYLDQLCSLIYEFRSTLEMEVPFIAGGIHNAPEFNRRLANLTEKAPGTAFVTSDGLTAYDRWHFDYSSAQELGKRYAAAFIQFKDKH
ncbi:MAG: hypothetical protein O2901_03450 [Verrucomicrobia bacterium]|nr:hypothetical protein [Verrucomicrobiota bacterium]